jgi:hypothetical protein
VEARPAPPASTRLGTREGDTLESIAAAIFPRDRAARGSYLAALRETNPDLAARGDREPIPPNETVALPDLRTFMQRRRARDTAVASTREAPSASAELAATAPAPREAAPRPTRPAPAARSAPPAQAPAPGPEPAAAPRRAAPAERPSSALAEAPPPPRTRPPSAPFQLKLSGSEVDLTPSRKIDDRSRAQLRERLLMLDADDQVAAMLSMRNSLRQLEARVAELQLKLAGMPPSLVGKGEGAAPPKAEAPAKAEPVAPAPAPVIAAAPKREVPPPAPAPAPVPKVEAPPPAPVVEAKPTPPPAPPKAEPTPPPPIVAAPATAPAPAPATEAAAPPEPRPSRAIAKPAPAKTSALPDWLWAVVALLVVLVLLLLWYMLRRRRQVDEPELYDEDYSLAPPPEPVDEIAPEHMPVFAEEPEPIFEPAPYERGVVSSDADLATRIPEENADELRRRYIEERFPEIVTRMIVLDNADSVVKGARLFYEDGGLPRAVELLQFAIEGHPEEVKSWLALFEIFRLERLTGEFASLAVRFKQLHGETEHWRKVQYFGREIDPGNVLYHEEPINTLQTIGPREARRIAAAASFDPIAENWLNAPMDFENEVLANELRMILMQHAGLAEEDLLPNPMPALRNVEMFTVA